MSKAGIYRISNRENGKFYVGSAVNLEKRFYLHRNQLDLGKHRNSHLQRAWDKHGADAFDFTVLQYVEDKTQLVAIEQNWIDTLRATELGYNICKVANSRLGVKASDETKARMSAAMAGKTHTEETRKKMSAAKAGVPKPPRSAEHREKLGAVHRGKIVSEETRAKLRAARAAREARRAPEGMKNA
jgi:group I intron endonuclease